MTLGATFFDFGEFSADRVRGNKKEQEEEYLSTCACVDVYKVGLLICLALKSTQCLATDSAPDFSP